MPACFGRLSCLVVNDLKLVHMLRLTVALGWYPTGTKSSCKQLPDTVECTFDTMCQFDAVVSG